MKNQIQRNNQNVAICMTTIFSLQDILDSYYKNISKFDHCGHVTIYIAGDNKTPPESKQMAANITRQGLNTCYMSIGKQKDYLKKYPDLAAIIPENSDNRRNVSFLMAIEEGADIIISVDDDNFPLEEIDFVEEHLTVNQEVNLPEAVGHSRWFNLCSLLEPEIPNLYARGFPYHARHPQTSKIDGKGSGKIGVNVGLWKGDPDADAIGRLYASPHITGANGQSVILGDGVLSPINTQNTALTRQAMAAYYYVRMGEDLRGMRLDRFGDIFSGYFLQVCVQAMGERIRIGSPLADHRRNDHNLFFDLYNELAGIMILEDLSKFLQTVQLPNESYASAYRELSLQLENFADTQEGFIWNEQSRHYFKKIGKYMRIWLDVVNSLL